jgi:hypothetical protein
LKIIGTLELRRTQIEDKLRCRRTFDRGCTSIISDEFSPTSDEDLLGRIDLVTVGNLCLIKPKKTSSVKPIRLGASRYQVMVGLWVDEDKWEKGSG